MWFPVTASEVTRMFMEMIRWSTIDSFACACGAHKLDGERLADGSAIRLFCQRRMCTWEKMIRLEKI